MSRSHLGLELQRLLNNEQYNVKLTKLTMQETRRRRSRRKKKEGRGGGGGGGGEKEEEEEEEDITADSLTN